MKRLLLATLLLSLLLAAPGRATVVFEQPHNGGGTLNKSAWYPPDGLDGDAYCWDSFSVASNTAITEVHWRGGYEYHPSGTGHGAISSFEVSIWRSIGGNSQPDLGAGGRLVRYTVSGTAGETAAGTFGGMALFDYGYTLPSPFQATGGAVYWVRIVAAQGIVAPSYAPDWGLATGTGGNGAHFRYITGGNYQMPGNDLAFYLAASGAPGVTITASASPAGSGTISGAGAYPIGSLVSLTAVANAGWGFVNWTEGATPVSTNPHYTFTAATNRTLVANFDTAYTVVTYAYPNYGGTTTGDGVYTRGSTVTLTATPAHGFVFNSWSDGTLTPTNTFAAASDIWLTAFFDSAPDAVTFDFDAATPGYGLPLAQTVNGLTAYFAGGFSVQQVGTVGIAPAGMSGNYLYPGSVFASDLVIDFTEALVDFSALVATCDIVCDASAIMRVTAYMDGVPVGTNTAQPPQGAYPSTTITITPPTVFNRAVLHWDAPGLACGDYAPIFWTDVVTVTRAVAPGGVGDSVPPTAARLQAPTPNPFQGSTTLRFELPRAGEARLVVFDVQGRKVRTLIAGPRPAGAQEITWDGRDDGGRPAGAGVYALRLDAAGTHATRRLVLLH